MKSLITILGAGESGIGAAILAKKHGYDVFLSDAGSIGAERRAVLQQYGVEYEEGGHSEEKILSSGELIKSPGIPDKAPLIQTALKKGIPVISEIEFAFRHLPAGARMVAITGTNGKTTTTLLTYHLLKTAGRRVALGGNVGVSLAKLVAEGDCDEYVVEISSFQLDGIRTFKPDVAVLLNITPDHMDRYGYSFQNYVDSKFRIIENQDQHDSLIYCADSEPVRMEIEKQNPQIHLLSVSTEGAAADAVLDGENLLIRYSYLSEARELVIPVKDVALIGKHNMVNAMCATLCALRMNVPEAAILEGLKTFVNAPHRLEPCGEIAGVPYINDSKATNVDAVYYALEGIKNKIVWIAGGTDKGNEYGQIEELVKDKVKGLICLGKDNEKLTQFFGGKVDKIVETQDVRDAIRLASDMAAPGDVVLLSPACASFDLFKNYEDRGNQFRSAVKAFIAQQEQEKV